MRRKPTKFVSTLKEEDYKVIKLPPVSIAAADVYVRKCSKFSAPSLSRATVGSRAEKVKLFVPGIKHKPVKQTKRTAQEAQKAAEKEKSIAADWNAFRHKRKASKPKAEEQTS
jgi:hypothetical protein